MKGIEIEYVDDDSGDLPDTQRLILSLIQQHERLLPGHLALLVGLHPTTVRRHTRQLKTDRAIEKDGQYWVLADGSVQAAEAKDQVSRLSYIMHEMSRLRSEARRILEALGKEIV